MVAAPSQPTLMGSKVVEVAVPRVVMLSEMAVLAVQKSQLEELHVQRLELLPLLELPPGLPAKLFQAYCLFGRKAMPELVSVCQVEVL